MTNLANGIFKLLLKFTAQNTPLNLNSFIFPNDSQHSIPLTKTSRIATAY